MEEAAGICNSLRNLLFGLCRSHGTASRHYSKLLAIAPSQSTAEVSVNEQRTSTLACIAERYMCLVNRFS